MKTASISELKARLSAFLDVVRNGDEVLVTDRGQPVARIVAVQGAAQVAGQRELLIRSGRMHGPSLTLPPEFWSRPRARDDAGQSLVALLEERADGR